MESGNANVNGFISDESSVSLTNKAVFSVVPKIKFADENNPYKLMDQDSTAMQLRLMYYDKSGGKDRVMFNLTWPQFAVLAKAVSMAMIFNIGDWDLAEKWDGPGHTSFTRIFGQPDADGLCQVRTLVLKRQSMRNGQVSQYPWYIEIQTGRAVKVTAANGSGFMKSGTFISDNKVSINLSDGMLWHHCYWGGQLMAVVTQMMKNNVLTGYKKIVSAVKSFKK